MIPNIPAVNKLSFDSEGNDERDHPGLLDLFPITGDGIAAACICLRRAHYNKPLMRIRRGIDDVECDVYPYNINGKLRGIHPNSKTDYFGRTLENFIAGVTVSVVRLYNQLDGGYGADAIQTSSSTQPNLSDSSGNMFKIGDAYVFDCRDGGNDSLTISNDDSGIASQSLHSHLLVSNRESDGLYYFGQAFGNYFGEVGNFGASTTTLFAGSYVSNDNSPNQTTAGEDTVLMGVYNGANSELFRDGVSLKTGDVGSNVYGGGSSISYGRYFSAAASGKLLGPITWINQDMRDKGEEISLYIMDLLNIT